MTSKALAASLVPALAIFVLHAAPAAAGTETTLYSFIHDTLGEPTGKLLFKGDALYGTGSGVGYGNGQVFKLTYSSGTWSEHSILKFNGGDGEDPGGGLVQDSSGALYGTTFQGGGYFEGVIFRLTYASGKWTKKVLHSFDGADGDQPALDLVIDGSGNLYGTTAYGGGSGCGGIGCGTVFKLAPDRTLTTLYTFTGGSDGGGSGALHRDSAGDLFGTSVNGGGSGCGGYGCGTVYEIAADGTFSVLYTFTGKSDGANPSYEPVVENSGTGALYGTAMTGGGKDGSKCGVVFQLTPSGGTWSHKTIYTFNCGGDGDTPNGLHWGGKVLYGTTLYGGMSGCTGLGCGTVFSLSQSGGVWSKTTLYSFGKNGFYDGGLPYADVILDKYGNVYGTAFTGGKNGDGTVWEVTP